MTDRIKGFTVVLDKDYRVDDVEPIQKAIEMIKGIVKVEPNITTSADYMNRELIKSEFINKFYKFLKEIKDW